MNKNWTVESLLRELQKYDKDTVVRIDSGCGCCGYGEHGIFEDCGDIVIGTMEKEI